MLRQKEISRNAWGGELLDLHQFTRMRFRLRQRRSLRISPPIDNRNLMYARHRAVRSAALFGEVFTADIGNCVLLERDRRIPALLRAVMHQPVLADIQITGAGAASPLVRLPEGDVVLKRINPGEA